MLTFFSVIYCIFLETHFDLVASKAGQNRIFFQHFSWRKMSQKHKINILFS